jgi:Flp pilus assembly protein TadD
MSEIRIAGSWPSAEVTVGAPTLRRGTNPLQDSLIRMDEAEQLRQQKKLDRAQRICESLLREHPDYVAALHTLGLVLADKENYEQALNYLVRAVMLNPLRWSTLTALSGVYLALDASEMAAQALEQARAIKPNDSNILSTLGEIYRQEREYELAQDAFRQALAIEETLEPAAVGLGWVCSFVGQDAEAADIFQGLLKRGTRSLEILAALASLPPALVTVDLLSELDKLAHERRDDKTTSGNTLEFVRAAALDRLGRHAEAWERLVPANRTVLPTMEEDLKDSSERERKVLAALRATPIKVEANRNDQPISLFILGPSRSGKTTMEHLVATLDGVKRGHENPSAENAIRRAFQNAGLLTVSRLEMLPPQLYSACRDLYLEDLSKRAGSAKVFTNTHPGRIFDIGPMATVFPNVRFIFVKRKVEDIVLRMYQRRYRAGNSYSYDLKAAREHVVWYHQMMDVMAEKLPKAVRIVHYEDMVSNPTSALRAAAELCELSMPSGPLPPIGDDRGCAEPYRQFLDAELKH